MVCFLAMVGQGIQNPQVPPSISGDRLENLLYALSRMQFSVGALTTSQADVTKSPSVGSSSQLILAPKASRRGLIVYNNDGAKAFLALGVPAVIGTVLSLEIKANEFWVMPEPVFTGAVYAVRSPGAGSGFLYCTEFT